jgi:hypothetical protein
MLDDTDEERKAYDDWICSRKFGAQYSDRDLFILGMRATLTKQPVGYLYERNGFEEVFSRRRIKDLLSSCTIETPLYRSTVPLPLIAFKTLMERLTYQIRGQLMEMAPEERQKVLDGLKDDPTGEYKE